MEVLQPLLLLRLVQTTTESPCGETAAAAGVGVGIDGIGAGIGIVGHPQNEHGLAALGTATHALLLLMMMLTVQQRRLSSLHRHHDPLTVVLAGRTVLEDTVVVVDETSIPQARVHWMEVQSTMTMKKRMRSKSWKQECHG